MAYIWEVTDALSLLTDIADSEKETAEAICQRALDEINAKLKPEVEQTDPRIAAAAAGIAFYKLCIKRCGIQKEAEMTSFKAGDLSISYSTADAKEQLSLAKEICDKAMLEITPLLSDNGFYFGKVDIYDANPA
ncbi:MAG: hypothetical protein IJZ57_10855 [Clostridia bacterium]|nr:hypothetical protein [Clostridia bacterium]